MCVCDSFHSRHALNRLYKRDPLSERRKPESWPRAKDSSKIGNIAEINIYIIILRVDRKKIEKK